MNSSVQAGIEPHLTTRWCCWAVFYFSLAHRKDLHSAPALLPVGWFSYNTHLHQNLPVHTAHPSRVCFHLIKHHRIPCCDSHQVSWINWTFCYITPKCGPSAQKQVPIYHSPLFSALLGVVLQGRNTMSAFKGMETSCSSTPGFPVWSGVWLCLCRVSQVLPGFSSFLQPPKKKKNTLGGIVMVCVHMIPCDGLVLQPWCVPFLDPPQTWPGWSSYWTMMDQIFIHWCVSK